jgi:AmmeMemoRadiSam system protein A
MSVIKGIMVPHPPMIVPAVGKGSEKTIELTSGSYEKAADFIVEADPETIVISSPHATMYSDYFHISPGKHSAGSFAGFGAPQEKYSIDYDEEMVSLIAKLAEEEEFPAGVDGECDPLLDHGVMVPLYFIKKAYEKAGKEMNCRFVRVGLSGLSFPEHYRLGKMIAEAADKLERRVAFVASGDLSHKLQENGPYGLAPEGPVYDSKIMDVMGRAGFDELLEFDGRLCDRAAECGHRSFIIMAGALDGMAVKQEKLSHEDVTGVGYGVCTYEVTAPDASRKFLDVYKEKQAKKIEKLRSGEDYYLVLARTALEYYVLTGIVLEIPSDVPEEMLERKAGAFVSLHKNGELRGCIGTTGPTRESLADEIIHNAVSAGIHDPRFSPVSRSELLDLEYNVDVLSDPEPVSSADELDPKKYGVIVSKEGRRGLLLPDLPGIDTVEEQLDIAKRKAGISPMETGVKLERFTVERHGAE